jgi:hypothetical protein
MKRTRPDARDQAKRAALNALKRARRAAALTGAKLSDWEGEFLGSVEDRIKTYGRAFADPEKGAPGQSLSMMQSIKLKEITVKAKGGASGGQQRPFAARKGFRQRPPSGAGR